MVWIDKVFDLLFDSFGMKWDIIFGKELLFPVIVKFIIFD